MLFDEKQKGKQDSLQKKRTIYYIYSKKRKEGKKRVK